MLRRSRPDHGEVVLTNRGDRKNNRRARVSERFQSTRAEVAIIVLGVSAQMSVILPREIFRPW